MDDDKTRTVVKAPDFSSLVVHSSAVRGAGDIIEVELVLDKEIPVTGSSRPTLWIGDEAFMQSRHPDGRLDRLLFLVPRTRFEQLPDRSRATLRILGRSAAVALNPEENEQ